MALRALSVLLSCLVATAALAADPIFPPGSRIGLVPVPGMEVSKRFTGFEDAPKGLALTLFEMPPEAYAELSASLTAEVLRSQGVSFQKREELKLGDKNALLVTGEQSIGAAKLQKWLLLVEDSTMTPFIVGQALAHPGAPADAAMRTALTSVAIRGPIPIDDQISALPFHITERSGFRPVRVMGGNAVFLTEGPNDTVKGAEQPIAILAQSAEPAPPGSQRDTFARALLQSSPVFKDLVFERAQGFRQRGAEWHEIVAHGVDVASGQQVVLTQAIRFGSANYVRMLGVVRADAREAALPRFRALFDGVEVN